ncbi:uncharacterized protein [Henckelia pumila]|uniref:uncharacterized protein n=1 Tax=Henckelia pumila TaxID=405737 RepID=UPI003C6E0417
MRKKVEEKKIKTDQKPMYKPPLPYPQRFKMKALDEQFSKFLEIFKKLRINIPFTDALLQMPNYAKFLKEVMSRKRNLEEFATVNLTEECSAILQKKLPQKLKDPGSFTIPYIIGSSHFNNALCNLGANINLMPFSIFRNLGLGEVMPTTIALQLADRSLTYPRGIIEDVLEDGNMPLILGRSFLATAEAKIDVKKGALMMSVDGEKVTFNVFKEAEKPSTDNVFLILGKMNKKKKRYKFKKVVEFVWRVKKNGKTSNKSMEPG